MNANKEHDRGPGRSRSHRYGHGAGQDGAGQDGAGQGAHSHTGAAGSDNERRTRPVIVLTLSDAGVQAAGDRVADAAALLLALVACCVACRALDMART